MSEIRAMIIEDSEDDALLIVRELEKGGLDPEWSRVSTPAGLEGALDAEEDWDVILADHVMPEFDAISALSMIKESGLDVPFIVVSRHIGEEFAVRMMKEGAADYVMKDNPGRLVPVVERELREAAERERRRQLELQLAQSQKMEAVGRLAAGIAHDFNNLLTAILSYADLSLEEVDAGTALAGNLEGIRAAAGSAADLTGQLLAFGRRQVMQPRLIDLNEAVADSKEMLERLIGEDIVVSASLCDEPALVRADPTQIRQVLLNLAVNAREAMPDGGNLAFRTEVTELESGYVDRHLDLDVGTYVMLSAEDDGIGMDAGTVERIFEPFFTTKGEGNGSGLGLATVHGIVKQSGGDVWVYSEPGEGTTFKVYVPFAEGEARPVDVASPASTGAHGGAETILVVEDDSNVREVARRILEGEGYEVVAAAAAEEALDLCRERGESVDLVVTDVIMPGMRGDELVAALRELDRRPEILFMSGYTGDRVGRALSGSEVGLLGKPFTPDELLRAVRQALDSRG